MATVNMSIRTDSELKAQAEAVLSQLGMTMNGTINMFLHQIVRDRAVPLSLSLSTCCMPRPSAPAGIRAGTPVMFCLIWIRSSLRLRSKQADGRI